MSAALRSNAVISLPYVADTSRDVLVYYLPNISVQKNLGYKRSNIASGRTLCEGHDRRRRAELFQVSKDDRVFGLIRYKSDDFSENSYSNCEVCVVMSLLMSVISREYNVRVLSELIILDKSCN